MRFSYVYEEVTGLMSIADSANIRLCSYYSKLNELRIIGTLIPFRVDILWRTSVYPGTIISRLRDSLNDVPTFMISAV